MTNHPMQKAQRHKKKEGRKGGRARHPSALVWEKAGKKHRLGTLLEAERERASLLAATLASWRHGNRIVDVFISSNNEPI